MVRWVLYYTCLVDAQTSLSIAPNAAPINVTPVVMSSTSIMVSWDEVPPIDRNGIVTIYEVLYEPLETFEGAIRSQIMNTADLFIPLTNLQEFAEYNISVRAYTSEGPGPYSEEITRRTLEDGTYELNIQLLVTKALTKQLSFHIPHSSFCCSRGCLGG